MNTLSSLCMLVAAATANLVSSGIAHSAEGDNDKRVLEEITVTAARREQSLQDTSMSISALTGDTLSQIGANDLNDYFGFVPSVNAASNTIGERGGKNIVIRGISNTRIAASTDASASSATTGFLINDIPITPIDTELFDVNRVEVLRGPQGTLYGTASMGGAAKLFLNQPDLFDFEGSVEGSVQTIKRGEMGGGLNMMVNVPVFEGVFGVRVAATHRQRDGYIDSAIIPLENTSGRIPSVINDVIDVTPIKNNRRQIDDANSATATGVSVSALYTPNDKLRVAFTQLLQRTEVDDLSFVNTRFGGQRLQEKYILEPNESKATLSALNITYGFDKFDIVSNTGFYKREYDESVDFTASTFVGYASVLDFVPAPVTLDTQLDVETFTQEIRFESNREAFTNPFLSRLDWVFGAFYSREDRGVSSVADGRGWSARAPNNPLALPNDIRSATVSDIEDASDAIFLDVNYYLTDKLAIGGGIRYFDLSTDFHGVTLNVSNPAVPTVTDRLYTEDGDSFRLGASYDVSDDIKAYGNFSNGFRLGGAVAPINLNTFPDCVDVLEDNGLQSFASGRFNSDDVETFEVGLKTTMAGGRATLNVSGYHTDWSGLQTQLRMGDLSNVCFATITANVGKAEVDGVEIELAALATENFSLQGTVAYTDAQIVDPGPGGLTQPGDKILNVPEWSGSLIARYEAETSALGGGTFFMQGDVRYIDEREPVTGNTNPALTLDAYTLVGARVGFVFGVEKPTTLTLWGKNLTDEDIAQNSRNRLGVPDVIVFQGLAQEIGLTLRKDF